MSIQIQEAQIILAIEAIRSSKKLSRRAAAKLYSIPYTTLSNRMKNITFIVERRPAIQNLTKIKKNIIVQYILDLDSRGFPPLIRDMAAMANHIFKLWNVSRVGKQWPYHFI